MSMTEEKFFSPDSDSLKKMVRLLELARRNFLENYWKMHSGTLAKSQFNQLMLIRFIMPCNLSRIMAVTGLTSGAASLFVEKLVQLGFLTRKDNPNDRRNVQITLTRDGQRFLRDVDNSLDEYISSYFKTCTEKELQIVAQATATIVDKLGHLERDAK